MPMMLSQHFSIDEAVVTQQRGLNNYPDVGTIAVMQQTAQRMERVREVLGYPIKINSWYRSPAVNAAVGGAKKSQHTKGEAVDFICPAFGSPFDVCKKLEMSREALMFDQLIYEHTWVHISFVIPPAVPRMEILTLQSGNTYVDGIVFSHSRGK